MKPKPYFYASTNHKGEKTIVTPERAISVSANLEPINLETIIKYLKLAYGIEIFVLPCWGESTKEDSLYLDGYTYSVSKSRHFTHSLWNKVVLNNLSQNQNKKDNKLESLSPCYPTQELALIAAIKYILDLENNTSLFDNSGYTYSGTGGFGARRIPHLTPFMALTDDNVDIVELYSFNEKEQRYYSVTDNTKFIEVALDGHNFLVVNTNEESWMTRIVFPIDNEEYGNYLLKQFTTNDE